MWPVLVVVGILALIGALIDWRTRRTGHRVPSGRDLDARIPQGTPDNSQQGPGNTFVRSRFGEVPDDATLRDRTKRR